MIALASSVTLSSIGDGFWRLDCMTTDPLNAEIWEQSPELQRHIQSLHPVLSVGSVGAQQAMIDGEPDTILPWVPDLIGKDWEDENSILIVGSAYAGFIKECSGRPASMPFSIYRQAQTAGDFQQAFFQQVVVPDRKYYGRIPLMLPENWGSSKIALFDLCRASFVQRANGSKRRDKQGDTPVKKHTHVFHKYRMTGQAAEWTWQRIIRSKAYRVVALGTIAEHGLLWLFASHGMEAYVQCQPQICFGPAQVTASVNWPRNYATGRKWILSHWYPTDSFWVIKGDVSGEKRTWYLRPTNHPARVSSETHPSFAATRSALAAMEQITPQTA